MQIPLPLRFRKHTIPHARRCATPLTTKSGSYAFFFADPPLLYGSVIQHHLLLFSQVNEQAIKLMH